MFIKYKIIGVKMPLIISNIKTNIPISVPRILNVLVAPVPLLPYSLKSIPLISFPNQTDKGIEPIRYDTIFNNFLVSYEK